MMLSDVCRVHRPKLRTIRPMKTKIGTEVAHVTRTRTPLSRSKRQRSRSPVRFTHRGVKASGSCSGERGNILTVWKKIRCGLLGGARRFSAHRGRRGAGHIVAAPAQLVWCCRRTIYNPFILIHRFGILLSRLWEGHPAETAPDSGIFWTEGMFTTRGIPSSGSSQRFALQRVPF